jgi:hypothetical protein
VGIIKETERVRQEWPGVCEGNRLPVFVAARLSPAGKSAAKERPFRAIPSRRNACYLVPKNLHYFSRTPSILRDSPCVMLWFPALDSFRHKETKKGMSDTPWVWATL